MFSSQLTHNQKNADMLGAAASGLCLIHCLATPLLFVAHAGATTCHVDSCCADASPVWWSMIDVIFLVISLGAVFWTAKKTPKQWVKVALAASWFLLAFIILNEWIHLIDLSHNWIYLPAASLIALHFYNMKYCQCEDEMCAIVPEHKPI